MKDVGIFDQTYSCLTRVVHEALTLYTHPLTVGHSSVEFVTRIICHLESFERTQLNSYKGSVYEYIVYPIDVSLDFNDTSTELDGRCAPKSAVWFS